MPLDHTTNRSTEVPQLRQEKTRHEWQAQKPTKRVERLQETRKEEDEYGINLTSLYMGIAAVTRENGQVDVGFAAHDGTYSVDFSVESLGGPGGLWLDRLSANDGGSGNMTPSTNPAQLAASLCNYFVDKIRQYEHKHLYKFLGAGITKQVADMSPNLPAQLWAELDIVPMVFTRGLEHPRARKVDINVDEEADSMARKCLMYFGPNQQPRLVVGYRNEVEVDASGHARLATIDQYQHSVDERTWEATMKYVESLKKRNIKLAFFNSTPQGGGVALMRHALIRFFRTVGVECKWYVPKPKPEVFRITKTNHNILQGVADPKERLTDEQKKVLEEWATQNATRFWTSEDGPLRPRSEGGADIIIVDDPQMPDLITLSKNLDPSRPVIFRSHIQIRSDLADTPGTPTQEVWQWLWSKVQHADLFISHPVRAFVPSAVPAAKVGYMPATTDWLDGLNKNLSTYDSQYYIHEFNTECYRERMTKLAFPRRDYIVQIARFDPSKGIPDVLASYAEFRRTYEAPHYSPSPSSSPPNANSKDGNGNGNGKGKGEEKEKQLPPQLVIAGHGAVDDPDASLIYDQTLSLLETKYASLKPDIVVLRLGPTDQLLNALLANAKTALQLSTREGFEVKVSEALHKGVPVIATRAGGIPLQIADGKSGFLVQPGDSADVARWLRMLFEEPETYTRMSAYARVHVSAEVSTVGNALAWCYLAEEMTKGRVLEMGARWVNDRAREGVGMGYREGETRLPREEGLELRDR